MALRTIIDVIINCEVSSFHSCISVILNIIGEEVEMIFFFMKEVPTFCVILYTYSSFL